MTTQCWALRLVFQTEMNVIDIRAICCRCKKLKIKFLHT